VFVGIAPIVMSAQIGSSVVSGWGAETRIVGRFGWDGAEPGPSRQLFYAHSIGTGNPAAGAKGFGGGGTLRDVMSFEGWYRSCYASLVAAVTVSIGDRNAAVEAVDEALVRALERWHRVGAMASPQGWAYRVAVNIDRRRPRHQALQFPHVDPPAAPQPPIDLDLWAAVESLPRRQREAIALRYVLDLRERDVAAVMGISEGAASATLTTARSRLVGLLREDDHGARS
jgi:RNA polymerase sigma factor (sigma-70 family)